MKRLKQCPVCRQRVGFQLDQLDGETKLELHDEKKGGRRCPGSRLPVSQR